MAPHRWFVMALATLLAPTALGAAQNPLAVDRARWDEARLELGVWGSANPGSSVSLADAFTGRPLGEVSASEAGRWLVELSDPSPVPCAVVASTADDAEVMTAPAASRFLLLHELAHLRYRRHGREHSDLWLHLMERYLSDRWQDER